MRHKTINGENGQDDEHGYLVSVSDIMAGLMFLFIITIIVFAINLHKQKQLKETETQELQEIQNDLTDAKEARKDLLEDLKKSLEIRGVIVRIDTDKGLLHVPEDILFESGKAQFMDGGERSLRILADILVQKLPCYCGHRDAARPASCPEGVFKPGRLEAVFIEGHTDNVPIGNSLFKDNWDLSAKRSIVTYQYMIKEQPNLVMLTNAEGELLFGVSGYAETRPEVPHSGIMPEPKNRRIDLRFILAAPTPEMAVTPKDEESGQ